MRAVSPAADDLPQLELPDAAAWQQWLAEHHATSAGAWLVFAKPGAPRVTVTRREVLDLALCFGWIDGQVRGIDERFWRQRYTPRTAKSRWSQINRERAEELIAEGRMAPAGQAEVDRAKADGRWEAAYAPPSRATVPEDFAAALDADPAARRFFDTLTSANRYALTYRINEAKRPETRAKRIAQYVEMCRNQQTFH